MGNTTTNSSKISNSVSNNFLTVSDNTCTSSANVTIKNVVGKINFLGGAKGDIDFGNVDGTLTSYCIIDQQLSQSAAAILAATSKQDAVTENEFMNLGVLYSRNHNTTNISQSMVNNMVTNSSNNCNGSANTTIANSAININRKGGKGDVRVFSVGNDTTSTCTISNVVGQESYADLESNVDQKAKTMGMFAAIAASLVSGMVILLFGIIILVGGGAVLTGAYKASGKKKSGNMGAPRTGYQYDDEDGEDLDSGYDDDDGEDLDRGYDDEGEEDLDSGY